MIEFYTLSWGNHIFIIFILGICILAQTLALVLNFFRYELNKIRIFGSLFEITILSEILVFSLLYGQMVSGYKNGFLVPTGYEGIRVVVFFGIFILAILVSIITNKFSNLSVIIAGCISLPIIENISRPFYPWLFIGALIFFFTRSIIICLNSIIAIKTNISALSIIHAINTLHTGVLFSENNGYIILSNYQIQNLMIAFTGKVFRNSIEFYNMLLSDEYNSRYKKVELDGQIVYLLKDESVWMFTKTDISFLMKNYIHISATDVSKLWALTSKLHLQEEELKHKSEELKRTIANLHYLSKEREIDNAKMRAHDILGQRLSVLLRMIQNNNNLDYDLLISLSKGLLDEIKAEDSEIQAYDELKNIQVIFTAIGVNIDFEGELPDDSQKARLFVDIIRESSTNAVRHGFATQIKIKSKLIDNGYELSISNNGHTNDIAIIPGSGIKLMRKKVTVQGGNLDIIQYPIFTLSVSLPGGEKSA